MMPSSIHPKTEGGKQFRQETVLAYPKKLALAIQSKFEGARQFLREVKTELKKVTWPSRKDTLAGTVVVLVTVFILGFFLGIADSLLSYIVKTFLRGGLS